MSTITPRTVSVTVEINAATHSLKDLKAIVRAALEAESVGRIRTIGVNVIQGSRGKARKAKRKR